MGLKEATVMPIAIVLGPVRERKDVPCARLGNEWVAVGPDQQRTRFVIGVDDAGTLHAYPDGRDYGCELPVFDSKDGQLQGLIESYYNVDVPMPHTKTSHPVKELITFDWLQTDPELKKLIKLDWLMLSTKDESLIRIWNLERIELCKRITSRITRHLDVDGDDNISW